MIYRKKKSVSEKSEKIVRKKLKIADPLLEKKEQEAICDLKFS